MTSNYSKNVYNNQGSGSLTKTKIVTEIKPNGGIKMSEESLFNYIKENEHLFAKSDEQIGIDNENKEVMENKMEYGYTCLNPSNKEKISLPKNLSSIFEQHCDMIMRHGVEIFDNNNNSSLLSSIFYCLDLDINVDLYESILLRFKDFIGSDYLKKYKYSKFGWDIEKLKNDLISLNVNEYVLRVISDYFHINIFILDIKKDLLKYAGCDIITYKKNIFICNIKNNRYEPIILDNKNYVSHNSKLILNIIENKLVTIMDIDTTNKSIDLLPFEEDLNKYIVGQRKRAIENLLSEQSEDNKFTEIEHKGREFTEKELKEKKAIALYEIAQNCGIDIKGVINGKKKTKTKPVLIQEILEYYDSKEN